MIKLVDVGLVSLTWTFHSIDRPRLCVQGSFPPPCGPESICSLLDEEALMGYVKDGGAPEQRSPFRYFVLDGTTIVALLEQSLGNDEGASMP